MIKKVFATLSLVTTICLFNNVQVTFAEETSATLESVDTTDVTLTLDDMPKSDELPEAAEPFEAPTSTIDEPTEVVDNPDITTPALSDTSEATDNLDNTTPVIDGSSKVTESYETPTTTIDTPIESAPDTSSNEKVIGVDSRTVVKNYLADPYKKIVLLKMHFKNGFFSGTGAMINKNTVLTAAHNVYDFASKSFADQITVLAGVAPGKLPLGTASVIQKFVPKEWINSGSSEHDFAVLKLDNDLGNKTGFFTFSSDVSINQPIQIAGYPGDKESNTQYSGKGKLIRVTDHNLYYDVDTYNGESGSPILNDKNLIIGVHTAGPGGYNFGTRINTAKLALIKQWSADIQELKYDKKVTISKSKIIVWKDLKIHDRVNDNSLTLGRVCIAKNEYIHPNGYRYLSLFDHRNNFLGYFNTNDVTDLVAVKFDKNVKIISKDYGIWGNFFWNKKLGLTSKYYNQTLKAKYVYTLGNGAKYYSLYDQNNKWIGYVNSQATR
ncbi:serine peptidase, S1 family [Staphylococcus microti]|uniref:Serine protease n=1 Tax=Staphylococcus microti TaxID=569857 RepID=A0A380GW72_9STAP|nr:trypsin-like serine protease [Staphylococcus microti]PNZ84461.1 trypsin [Staphylococcus microti]SUM58339.1 serine peptidase, S1 family [Staphylococcus microti]